MELGMLDPKVVTRSFRNTMSLLRQIRSMNLQNRIGEIAEEANHDLDSLVYWIQKQEEE